MALTLTNIIHEADIRMPSTFDDAQKVSWLNEVNAEFFDVVKIPKIAMFVSDGTGTYTLATDVRHKNIDNVQIGTQMYMSAFYETRLPGRNYWIFDDNTHVLNVVSDTVSGSKGIVRYHAMPTKTFISSVLTDVPDAPPEYHWLYILGLCERIAKAMDDILKANNFASEYQNNLAVAQANYARR